MKKPPSRLPKYKTVLFTCQVNISCLKIRRNMSKKDTISQEIYVTIEVTLMNTTELNPFYITNMSAGESIFAHC